MGGLEAVAFGTLILIVGVLLISQAWSVIDATAAARTAAREGARTYATAATSDPGAAAAQADAAVRDTLTALGWDRPGTSLYLVGPVFLRCATVTYVVSIPVPAFRLPWIGTGPAGFHATAHHTELVDPYRSGVPGDPLTGGSANCDSTGPPP